MHWICRCRAHWTGGTIRVMHFQYIQHLKDLRIEQNCIDDFDESTGNVEKLQNSIDNSKPTSQQRKLTLTIQSIQLYLSVTECHRTIYKIQKGKNILVIQNTCLYKRLQFYNTFRAGEFWQIKFVFFLNVIWQESSRQKMFSRETCCALFGSCQRNENFWIYPIFGRFVNIPTFRKREIGKVNPFSPSQATGH